MNEKVERYIKETLKRIEALESSIFTYSYKVFNPNKTYSWWEVSVSDYDFYKNSVEFRKLANQAHRVCKVLGGKVIFVCGWKPTEKQLLKLLEEGNLILNLEE